MATEGVVYLVGAGPGDPELITIRGVKLLRQADVIVYDRLVNERLLSHAPTHCELVAAGKTPGGPSTPQRRINRILLGRARQGKTVVRLKGGDPFLFGRGGEELVSCRTAGIRCEVVPGVSSALGGPASLQIPLTHRSMAHNLTIVSGHSDDLDFENLARVDTVVMLMGVAQLSAVLTSLMQAGKKPETPAAAVQWATRAQQRSLVSDLRTLAAEVERKGLGAPMVVVIGDVVELAWDVSQEPVRHQH